LGDTTSDESSVISCPAEVVMGVTTGRGASGAAATAVMDAEVAIAPDLLSVTVSI
jgi:hypothetical protein